MKTNNMKKEDLKKKRKKQSITYIEIYIYKYKN